MTCNRYKSTDHRRIVKKSCILGTTPQLKRDFKTETSIKCEMTPTSLHIKETLVQVADCAEFY